jgi:hypothetical protein
VENRTEAPTKKGPMADTLTDAQQMIEARLREVRDELASLESALRNLGRRTGGRRASGTNRSTSPRRRRRKTATRDERMQALAAQARKTPGASNPELARALGVTPSYISQLLTAGKNTGGVARRNGKLVVQSADAASPRKQGGTRSTKWRGPGSSRAKAAPAARRKKTAGAKSSRG